MFVVKQKDYVENPEDHMNSVDEEEESSDESNHSESAISKSKKDDTANGESKPESAKKKDGKLSSTLSDESISHISGATSDSDDEDDDADDDDEDDDDTENDASFIGKNFEEKRNLLLDEETTDKPVSSKSENVSSLGTLTLSETNCVTSKHDDANEPAVKRTSLGTLKEINDIFGSDSESSKAKKPKLDELSKSKKGDKSEKLEERRNSHEEVKRTVSTRSTRSSSNGIAKAKKSNDKSEECIVID